MFLHDIDYKAHMRAVDLAVLTNSSNVTVRNFAENAGVEEIKSYLRRRYDVTLVFINVRNWNIAVTYNEGDHVVKDEVMYYAIAASTGQDPANEVSYWTEGDLRDPYLVMRCIDVVTYHLYAKIPKRTTPEDVGLRYDETIKWLNGVSKGEFIPSYPLLSADEDNEHNEPRWGSQTQQNHKW